MKIIQASSNCADFDFIYPVEEETYMYYKHSFHTCACIRVVSCK